MTRRQRRPDRNFRLRTEALEDRTVPDATLPGPSYATDHIIVRMKPMTVALAPAVGVRSLGGLNAYTVPVANGATVAQTVSQYRAMANVLYAEPDYASSLDVTPQDPQYADGTLWGLNNTGQSSGVPDADIDAPEGWDFGHDASSVKVAVIDTGIDYNHPDLAANIWTNPGEIAGDGIDNDHNGYIDDVHGYDFFDHDSDPMDDYNPSHGTHVSGTIAAVGDNNTGVVGVAWKAQLMALKIFGSSGSTFTSNEVEAINYSIKMGAKISSNSWGGTFYSDLLKDAIAAAGKAGQIFVAAAGNDSVNNDTAPHYPSAFNLDNIVSVASLTRTDTLSSFSNYGALTADLGAPGSSIYSTYSLNLGSYATLSGTSMATPHVSGALALLKAAHPDWTVAQLKDQLLATTVPIPALAGITVSGGRLNLANLLGPVGPPQVLGISPVNAADGTVSHVQLRFNVPVDPKTVGPAVKVTGTDGSSLKAKVKPIGTTGRNWDVSFPKQTFTGTAGVRVFIAPTLKSAGGFLDGNGNGTGGEAGVDQFVGGVYSFTGAGGSIADNAATDFPLTVTNVFTVRDVNVQVTINHPYDSDLKLELVAPNNATVPIFLNSGLNGDGLKGTWFDDQIGVQVKLGTAPFAGTFQPASGLAPFNGLPAAGIWKLRITDGAAGAFGSLVNWRLSLATDTPQAAPTVTAANFAFVEGAWPEGFQVDFSNPIVASTFSTKDVKVTGPTGKSVKVLSVLPTGGAASTRFIIQTDPMLVHGNYKLTIGPALADINGSSLDTNGNLIFAEKAVDANTQTLTATEDVFRATKAQNLLDGKGTTVYDPNQIAATISVKSAAKVANVRVGFNITHTYASDLRISLVSPKGTTLQLINRRPFSGGGTGYVRTIMDDAATLSIASGTSPFVGAFRPESPLSVFDGEDAGGTWKLVIEDGWLGDTGKLLSWALYITPAVIAPPFGGTSAYEAISESPSFGVAIDPNEQPVVIAPMPVAEPTTTGNVSATPSSVVVQAPAERPKAKTSSFVSPSLPTLGLSEDQ
ncbi:MAG TPA: S8 family serine peptidase [Gemmataceae bacterium]|jgi:subtilisin family serine protease/subtilisin-like proprotein convertase family protein|nr:S8 family serine peptidase [Gemmataceae bacterium]